MIRKAKMGDMPRLLEFAEEMYQRSIYADKGDYEKQYFRSAVMQSIQRHGLDTAGGACVYVSEANETVDGFIVGVLEPVYHYGKPLQATDLFFYVTDDASPKSALGLFRTFMAWAQDVPGCIAIVNGSTDAIGDYQDAERIYKAAGLEQCGVIYRMEIER